MKYLIKVYSRLSYFFFKRFFILTTNYKLITFYCPNYQQHAYALDYLLSPNKDLEFLNKTLTKKEKLNIIDIGANIGFSFLNFKYYFNNSQIFCIDPIDENISYLKKNLRKFSPVIINIGCSNIKGEISIGTPSDNFIDTGMYSKFCENNSIKISTNTLDSIMDNYNLKTIDLIKIDIEGMEYEALLGSKKIILNYSPIIYLEINKKITDDFDKINSLLKEFDYSYVNHKKINMVKSKKFDMIWMKN